MTTSLIAVIDIDGTIANPERRYGLARSNGDGRKVAEREPGVTTDKAIAHDPAHVALDELIPGADAAVRSLILQGYDVVYLTSRPESLREATVAWLAQYDLDGHKLIMKQPGSPKTPGWKAIVVYGLASQADNVLFVDDDQANREAVAALNLANVTIKESLLKQRV